MDANGKVALVTGGASGMGQIYARRLAANGAKVAIFDVNQQGLDATEAESDNITAFHCDISSLEDVNTKVAQVEDQLGPIDVLVHAAALMPAYSLAEHSHEGMEQLFRINYFGTTYMVRAVLPSMQARGAGRIMHLAQLPVLHWYQKWALYCATKAAVNAYIEVLQNEIRGTGVRAHLICPPAVNTPLVDSGRSTQTLPEVLPNQRKKADWLTPKKLLMPLRKVWPRTKTLFIPVKPNYCTSGVPWLPGYGGKQ